MPASSRTRQKEFAEANLTLALVTDGPLPLPQTLSVDIAAFMNGLAEAVGELRRYILDGLRNEDDAEAERYLEVMDEIITCSSPWTSPTR